MDAAAIITVTHNHGVRLTADVERVIARPANKLTSELRAAIRTRKPELLGLLQHDNRPAGFDSDTVQKRHPDDGQRRQAGMPCAEGHDDRRCKDHHTEIQTSFDARADSTEHLIKNAAKIWVSPLSSFAEN
jgi:hypothetical protein